VVSDRDGLLLAESGVGDDAVVISAIVPRMLGQIRENMTELDHDDVDSASISMRGRLLTVIDNGDVYLSVLHESNRLTSGMLKLVRRLAEELEWLLSYRGYVSVPGEENAGANGSV
jgi:predicted regulator of Ras-like GTPase activity (Roadblock/LC7/MglB family)